MSGHWSFIHKVLCRFKKNYHKSMLKSKHGFHYWDEKMQSSLFFCNICHQYFNVGKRENCTSVLFESCLGCLWPVRVLYQRSQQ